MRAAANRYDFSLLYSSVQMFSTLKKEIETTNKKRVTAVRERDELRRRSDKAEEENSLLRKQVGGAGGGLWRLVPAVSEHSLVAAAGLSLLDQR